MRILCVLLVALSPGIAAQQPTATQVQQALQAQPGLADQVRSRIAQSGMTPDQIRARLTASGYPATLLDPYLSTGAAAPTAPSPQSLAAMQPLGPPVLGRGPISRTTAIGPAPGGGRRAR